MNPRMPERHLSVIIPTWNEERDLPKMMESLWEPDEAESLIQEVLVADGGSHDKTPIIAEAKGAILIPAAKGRGRQMHAGAKRARAPWLLFLHADVLLEEGWASEVQRFINHPKNIDRSAAFRFALLSQRPAARRLEKMVALRSLLFRLSYGDQGLLISKTLYEQLGGFPPWSLMEDVAFLRRIPRARRHIFATKIHSSERRYQKGYLRAILKNQLCLALYFLGVPPQRIAKIYEAKQ